MQYQFVIPEICLDFWESNNLYLVRFLGIDKIEEEKMPKILIPERVQSLLAEFSELVYDDLPNRLLPIRDFQH